MPCTCPLDAWPASPEAPDRRPVFSSQRSYAGARPFSIPCGRCYGCLRDRSRDWATRGVHESQMHEASYFITPTYSPEHVPCDVSVSVGEVQRFYKKLRKAVGPFSHLTAGEYSGTGRPHYHGILFGSEFSDLQPWSRSGRGEVLYRSATLDRVWGLGHCLVGAVNIRTVGYVAGYASKAQVKLRKLSDEEKLQPGAWARRRLEGLYRFDGETGETWHVTPEFLLASKRPAIGFRWFVRYARDAFPSDFVIVDGLRRPVPSYYSRLLEVPHILEVCDDREVVDGLGDVLLQRLVHLPELMRVVASRRRGEGFSVERLREVLCRGDVDDRRDFVDRYSGGVHDDGFLAGLGGVERRQVVAARRERASSEDVRAEQSERRLMTRDESGRLTADRLARSLVEEA